MLKVWNIEPGRADEPDVLYAGVQPASLFKSTDRGESWVLNESLYDHPQRGQWNPGAGGLCLHSIVLDPRDPQSHVRGGLGSRGLSHRRRRANLAAAQ